MSPRRAPAAAPIIGILGGSFDPVHAGHMTLAHLALDQLGLSEVRFLPAARPPHKTRRRLTDAHHRHAMLALATLEEPRFRISIEELARAGRSYTIDTLERLKTGEKNRRRWCFLIGADAFAEIDTWKSARRVLEAIEFVVYPRGGVDCAALRRRLPGWVTRHLVEHAAAEAALLRGPGGLPRAHWVPLEAPDVSSTEVRRRAARGGDLTGLVPALVAHYISQYGLYGRRKGGTA